MSKLYELLAVYESTTGQASKVRGELAATFDKKRHLFEGRKKTFRSLEENVEDQVEAQQEIQSTVAKEIRWISGYLAKSADVAYQIDVANTEAKADVVDENGDVLLKQVPATTLLQLAKRVAEWKDLILAIPTLDPAKGFVEDKGHGAGHWKAREVVKPRTVKTKKVYVKYEATKEHPAQTELLDADVLTGTTLEQEWSGLITPSLKAELLDRVEALYRAVTKARSKANDHAIEINDKKIGADLLEYVFKPLLGA
jgi:uncharacterized FlaG/YvyC family protein